MDSPSDYVPAPFSEHTLFALRLDAFEGPLDLLLFLIKRHDLDVLDIPIAFICARYVECIEAMQELSIDVAAEFFAMAAELVLIKSRCLLPEPDVEDDEEGAEPGDPRAELVERLLEYQKFQEAARQLETRPRLDRDVFAHTEPSGADPTPRLREANPFVLLQAFGALLKRQKPQDEHRVVLPRVSLKERMTEVIQGLGSAVSVSFADLFAAQEGRLNLVVSFLAILELMRLKLLRAVETENGDLHLQRRFTELDVALRTVSGTHEEAMATGT